MTTATMAQDAITILKADHEAVSQLFAEYRMTHSVSNKRELVAEICTALSVHAQIEAEIVYPAVLLAAQHPHGLPETLAEHDTLRDLMGEIEAVEPHGRLYDAKVKVLSAYVKRRIKDTHQSVFPIVRASSLDLCALGARIAARKAVLLARRA